MLAMIPPDPPPIVGRATVIDGDTLEIHGQRIRLWGIDAPESRQTCTRGGETYRCGQEAANALDRLLAGSMVTCEPQGRPDRYRRTVARCSITFRIDHDVFRKVDVARHAVEQGHALDFPRYSAGAYASAEAGAQDQRRGVWAGTFERPWAWRTRSPRPAP